MKISQAELNSSDVLDLPCFKFGGIATDKTGRRLSQAELRELFGPIARRTANAIVAQALLLSQNKALLDPRAGNAVIIPDTVFNCDPTPQAVTNIQAEGEIQINLGLFFRFLELTRTIAWMKDCVQRTGSISVGAMLTLEIPKQVVDEVKGVMRTWSANQRAESADLAVMFPDGPGQQYQSIEYVPHEMLIFAAFHEFAHWYQTSFRPSEWDKLMSKTKEYVVSWLSDDSYTDDGYRQKAGFLFRRHPDVLAAWSEEVQSDILAVQFCEWYFSDGDSRRIRQARQDTYTAQALLYGTLQLSEIYYEHILKRPPSWQTHPPVYIRKNIFCYVGSKELKLSLADFISKEWGAGTFITAAMERLLNVAAHEY